MEALSQRIYNELRWFSGRSGSLTTALSNDNGYEYYHEGRMQIMLRENNECGQMVDILVSKDDYCIGPTLQISQFKDYTVEYRELYGYLLHKALTIYLHDGSMVILAAENSDEGDPRETDIHLPDGYMRYLFHLPIKGDR